MKRRRAAGVECVVLSSFLVLGACTPQGDDGGGEETSPPVESTSTPNPPTPTPSPTPEPDWDGDGIPVTSDCDDLDPSIYPGADEYCDGEDNDCDSSIDESDAVDASEWYRDADADGYGTTNNTLMACEQPKGFVDVSGDCNDQSPLSYPGADELCGDALDNDCDGQVDESDAIDTETYCYDGDGDGFGDPAQQAQGCLAPDSYVSDCSDCDDTQPDVSPGLDEICDDGLDNDCDGVIDEDVDADGDGIGMCEGDCDDTSASIHPGAVEVCNDTDDDCDGVADEGYDIDGDGYSSCATDCDDTDPSINPDAVEVCNGVDDDCDGGIDNTQEVDYYPDRDGDGYGDAEASPTSGCEVDPNAVPDNSDCDDGDADIHPGSGEICDGLDNDCNGAADDSFYEGSGQMEGVCGIRVILPPRGALAVPEGFQISVDFDSNDPFNQDNQPYAIADTRYLWLTLSGSDGSLLLNDDTHNDFGDPVRDDDIPTRLSWPNTLNLVPGVEYTLDVLECQNLCSDPGSGWLIRGRSHFMADNPCGTSFNIKNELEIVQMGDTAGLILDGMTADVQSADFDMGMFFLDVPSTVVFPIDDLPLGFGPVVPDPVALSDEWGMPTFVETASISVDGWLSTPPMDMVLVVTMNAGNFVLNVQDAMTSAQLSSSGGIINEMTEYTLEGYVQKVDMDKILIESGLDEFSDSIKYDTDLDGDGLNEAASMVIVSKPVYLAEVDGVDSPCED